MANMVAACPYMRGHTVTWRQSIILSLHHLPMRRMVSVLMFPSSSAMYCPDRRDRADICSGCKARDSPTLAKADLRVNVSDVLVMFHQSWTNLTSQRGLSGW